ncbi:hypothetical protein EG68_05955 [Paragonimus skrjabini miyazakii]|uniref:Uncharacterized protein n=1 Tax=Paragonimus skrjabini miyazakii TaxID=59628 RepID=A0A8S9YTG2_9TREM|nr:hypothetical protein EG68_05955 [Paragonimus skrjabini miyazakii]
METGACLKVRKTTEVSPDWVEMNLPTLGLPEDIGLDGRPRNATSSTALRSQTTYIAIGAALVFLFYLVYLIECWNCPVWLTANCMVDSTTAYNWINVLRLSVPSIYWHVNCYHYESGQEATKVGTHLLGKLDKIDVNSLDTKAVNTMVRTIRPRKQTGARCGKVITASGIHVFDTSQLEGVWDYSDTVTHLERYPMVQIDIHTDYVFADEVSCQLFTYQRQQFFTNFEDIDEYMETHQTVQFTEKGPLPSRIWITGCFPQVPICLRQTTFFLTSLLLLSFPLRVWIHRRMARVNYTVRKVFGSRPITTNGISLINTICPIIGHKTGDPSNFLSDRPDMTKSQSTANNEATVLCNQEFSLRSHSSDKRRLSKIKGDHVKDDGDDEELLSLDIRYEEFIKGACTVSDEIVHNKYVTEPT